MLEARSTLLVWIVSSVTVKISDRFEKFPRALFTYRGKKLIQNFTNNNRDWVHRTIGVYYTAVVSNIVCFNIIIIENSEMIAILHRYFIKSTNVDLIMI